MSLNLQAFIPIRLRLSRLFGGSFCIRAATPLPPPRLCCSLWSWGLRRGRRAFPEHLSTSSHSLFNGFPVRNVIRSRMAPTDFGTSMCGKPSKVPTSLEFPVELPLGRGSPESLPAQLGSVRHGDRRGVCALVSHCPTPSEVSELSLELMGPKGLLDAFPILASKRSSIWCQHVGGFREASPG